MISIKNITKTFGGVTAINKCSFEIPAQRITAIVGPNGAGKTTLLDVISGFLKPDGGDIFLNNSSLRGAESDEATLRSLRTARDDNKNKTNIAKLPPYRISALGINRTFQQVRLFKHLSIIDHFLMAESNDDMFIWKNIYLTPKPDSNKYFQLLKDFGLDKDLHTQVSDLSYGQQKLLQIAMVTLRPHRILLLDEPIAGVNDVVQERIENLLIKLKNKGETIVIVEHDMKFVKKIADYVVVMDVGKVLIEGEPQKVLQDPKVLEAYLGE